MTVRFRSTAICIAMTSIKIGSRCGCYTVIASVRVGAQKYRMTMHCNECGREFERGRSAWHELDTTHCICDYLERTQQCSVIRKNAACHSKQSHEYITRKKEFERYVKATLKKYPDTKHDDFDTVWNAVGPKPEDTEFVKWYLTRKFRGRRCRDFTADNMEWHRVTTKKAVSIAQSMSPKRTHRSARYAAMKNNGAESQNDFELGVDRMWVEKRRRLVEEYNCFIGRKFGSFRVVDVSKTVTYRRSAYTFVMVCERCGKSIVKQASKVLKKVQKCTCHSHAGQSAKNSSTTYRSPIMRRRLRDACRKRILTGDRYDTDMLRMLQAHVSEYTLYAGTEQTIYALVDNAIVESAANDARREYLEWLER